LCGLEPQWRAQERKFKMESGGHVLPSGLQSRGSVPGQVIRGPEVECLLALELVGRPEKGANLHFLMALSAAEKRVGSFLFTARETKDAEKIADLVFKDRFWVGLG